MALNDIPLALTIEDEWLKLLRIPRDARSIDNGSETTWERILNLEAAKNERDIETKLTTT